MGAVLAAPWFVPAVTALTSAIGIGVSAKQAHDQKKQAKRTAEATITATKTKYNAAAEKRRAAMAEAEANKRRVMDETNTVKTTALGNTGGTQTQKKTLLGG